MYISKIELKNIRCFTEFSVDLNLDNDIIMWSTILGNNSVGKTTILKCIALGLTDISSASGLMKEDPAPFVRKDKNEGIITITLRDTNKSGYSVETTIYKSVIDDFNSPEIIKRKPEQSVNLWKDVFLCGYGVQIGDAGGRTFDTYNALEAVYTLFNSSSELQSTEGIMFQQQDIGLRDLLSDKLMEILLLKKYDDIEYPTKGMFVHGPWGMERVTRLSDGYRRIIQIVVDFFGWQIVAEKLPNEDNSLKGIIIIDEIETHLHPSFQRFIIDRIQAQLPLVQFITTTHSPLIALGTADLDSGLITELDFSKDEENKIDYINLESKEYQGYSVDQILTSSAFDLPTARSGFMGELILEYRELWLKKDRDNIEEEKLNDLKKNLDSILPEFGELEEDRQLRREIKDMLNQINTDQNDSTKKST